jgi:hypothetical protein
MNQNILIFRNWASFAQTKLSQFQTSKKTREQLVYGYFYSADSLKIFVKTERHSLIRLAEVGSAFSFKWVPRQMATMMSKLKKTRCNQDCSHSGRCVTPGQLLFQGVLWRAGGQGRDRSEIKLFGLAPA